MVPPIPYLTMNSSAFSSSVWHRYGFCKDSTKTSRPIAWTHASPQTPHVPATADEELLCCLGPGYPISPNATPERVNRIRDEVAYGFAAMADVAQAVSIFDRRTPPDHPTTSWRHGRGPFGARGFDIITGGGPGIMEAANRGARDAAVRSIGLISSCPTSRSSIRSWIGHLRFRHFFVRKLMFIRYASAFVVFPADSAPRRTLRGADVDPDRENPALPVVLAGSGHWNGLDTRIRAKLLDGGWCRPRTPPC